MKRKIVLFSFILLLVCRKSTFANEYIKQIQTKLYDYGYLSSTANITGYIDEKTEKAFENFKLKNCLPDLKLENPNSLFYFNTSYVIENTIDYSSSPDLVYKYQQILHSKFLYNGKLDGQYNFELENAVLKYQSSMFQPETGYISPITRFSLDAPNKKHTNFDFIRLARKRENAPYVLGKQGPYVYDCSGFVYWCLRQAGLQNDRISTFQWRKNKEFKIIPKEKDLQIGDIILWENHMGIISGKGKFIDCSASLDKVGERNIEEVDFIKFICGYRIY